MNDQGDISVTDEQFPDRTAPDDLGDGATDLLACSEDPARDGIGLGVVHRFGAVEDTALLVTATEGSEQAVERYQSPGPSTGDPSLRLVDTVSQQQSIAAVYDDTPVIFTPSQGDLERLVMALSELTDPDPPTDGSRHLLVRSLTPIIDASSIGRVQSVLERMTGLRSADGLCLLALDSTSHDEETLALLSELVDGIRWVRQSTSGGVEFEYRPARVRSPFSLPESVGED